MARDGIQMPPPPPRPGLAVRTLILLLVKAREKSLLRPLWRRQRGLLHVSNICIKIRPNESLAEAHAMQFVAHHTSIPVPEVYYAFVHKGNSYIVMRHIKGQMAAYLWRRRSEESKARILEQLRGMVAELRSIPVPDGAGVGNIEGGPLYDCRLPSKLYWGPFASVREFHSALVNGLDLDVESCMPNFPDLPELFEFHRKSGEELVLTHGDLSSLNIMVRGDDVVGIIDWETAGWFPPYWEYSCARYVNFRNEFWADYVDRFLEPMPYELRMEAVRRKYFGDF